ncbi:MAG: alpha/beta hydrolase fold domain-containing protein [Actinophytocola sp.]|nr:alpha/beta hydrolase fold domain-containing protein [Actinophytocola sp.]
MASAQPNRQAQAVLDERARAGVRPMREAPIAESRAVQWEWIEYMGQAEPVARCDNRIIPTPTAEILVRVYTPEGHGPFPALVVFHGGCWIVGNIEIADRPHRALANATGCVVVAVNYQKAPEHPFPVPLDDCFAAFTWTLEHAHELNVDPARVGVGGDSAGGNLAAAVCLKARDTGAPMPVVQLLIYPAVDSELDTHSAHEHAEGYGLTTADMQWSWRQYAPDPRKRSNPLASPLRAATLADLPPAIVVTAEFDVLRDEGKRYADRLETAGVPVIQHHYGTIHGFLWMAAAVDECRQMLQDIGQDFRSAWAGGP